MTQQALPVASHRVDPWTSHAAEREHAVYRRLNIAVVLSAIEQTPGATADDLATITGLDVYEVRRRCSDLKNQGRIEQGAAVRRKGRAVISWWLRRAVEVPA